MITSLELQNFKCFQFSKLFEFSNLNLLTGINGRGKSSLLQSMLILSQSAWRDSALSNLQINGELLELGNYDDIKNSETPRGEEIRFTFTFKDSPVENITLRFTENPDEPLLANRVVNGEKDGKNIRLFSDLIKKIHFVSADRLGPAKYVEKTTLSNFAHVGPRGEYTTNILANSMNFDNVTELLYRGNDAKSVYQQTIEWLSYILEGAKIGIGGREKESSVLYMLLNNKPNAYEYKPANVGFGYSYILPLIVTGLIAKPGEIIIVENPEAHLHPRAQSKIAEFFSIVASCGVQVFIESHSEHILNGLRVSALNPKIGIRHDNVSIHFFNEFFESEKLSMDSHGKIKDWPGGFFDQQEVDLAAIFKYGRQ